jgi:hypothetical protein
MQQTPPAGLHAFEVRLFSDSLTNNRKRPILHHIPMVYFVLPCNISSQTCTTSMIFDPLQNWFRIFPQDPFLFKLHAEFLPFLRPLTICWQGQGFLEDPVENPYARLN